MSSHYIEWVEVIKHEVRLINKTMVDGRDKWIEFKKLSIVVMKFSLMPFLKQPIRSHQGIQELWGEDF